MVSIAFTLICGQSTVGWRIKRDHESSPCHYMTGVLKSSDLIQFDKVNNVLIHGIEFLQIGW